VAYSQKQCLNVIQINSNKKVHKFSVHLFRNILRWIFVGMFLTVELSAHVRALWRFLVMFYPPATPRRDKSRQKLKHFIEHLPTWRCSSHPYWFSLRIL